MARKICYGYNNTIMKEAEALVVLWTRFGFYSNTKGALSNLEEDIWKMCVKKAPVKSANATNVNQHRQQHT